MDSKKSREAHQEALETKPTSPDGSSDKINKLLEKKARQFKSNKSFEKVKTATARDLGELQTIDIKKQSKQNLQALRQRLNKLTSDEKVLFERLMKQPLILHHTTRNQVIEEIKATTGALRDPHELARFAKTAQDVHTPDFAGFNENVFFGLGTPLSEIPVFTRLCKDPSTKKPVDYCTVRIDLGKLQAKRPDVFDSLWSSGHLFPFLSMTHAKSFQQQEVAIGDTQVEWRYEINNAMSKEEERDKCLTYTYANGDSKEIKMTMKDEVAVGHDLIPFYALSFIERFRLLDEKTKESVLKNPNDQDALAKLLDVFFPVNEFEIHIPANMPLDDEYTSYITPTVRKQMTEAVTNAAKKGDIPEVAKLHEAGYPIQGYMYDDPFRFDNDSTVDNPLIASIKEKEHKAVEWFLEQGVYQDAFDRHSASHLTTGIDELATMPHIAKILTVALEARDVEMVKMLVDEWQLKINHYFESKLSDLIKSIPMSAMDLMKTRIGREAKVFDYNSKTSDITFLLLLKSCLPPTDEIYQFLDDKLDYCKSDNFIVRVMYDIASIGTSEQMAYHQQSNPYYAKCKPDLLKMCLSREETLVAAYEMIKEDKQAIKGQIDNLPYVYQAFSVAYADLLFARMGFEDDPEDLRKFLGEEWVARFIANMTTQRGIEKQAILARVTWLVERLQISPSELMEERYQYSYPKVKQNIITCLCSQGCFAEAKAYIEQGHPAHYENVKYNPIHYALMKGDVEFANYLLNEKKVPVSFPDKFIKNEKFAGFTPESLNLAIKLGAIPDRDSFQSMLWFRKFDLAESYHQQGLLPWDKDADNDKIKQCNFIILATQSVDDYKDFSNAVTEWLLERNIISLDIVRELYDYCNKTKFSKMMTDKDDKHYENLGEDKIAGFSPTILIQLLQLFVKHITPVEFNPSLLADLLKADPMTTFTFCKENNIPLDEMIKSSLDDKQKEELLKGVCEKALEYTSEAPLIMILTWMREACAIDVDQIFKTHQKFLFDCIVKAVTSYGDFHTVLTKLLPLADDLGAHEKRKGIRLVYEAMGGDPPSRYDFAPQREPRVEDFKLLLQHGADPYYSASDFKEGSEMKAYYEAMEEPERVYGFTPDNIKQLVNDAKAALADLQKNIAASERAKQISGLFQGPNLDPYLKKTYKYTEILDEDFTDYEFDKSLHVTPAECKQLDAQVKEVVEAIESYFKEKELQGGYDSDDDVHYGKRAVDHDEGSDNEDKSDSDDEDDLGSRNSF